LLLSQSSQKDSSTVSMAISYTEKKICSTAVHTCVVSCTKAGNRLPLLATAVWGTC
jgi:hypothetical protein